MMHFILAVCAYVVMACAMLQGVASEIFPTPSNIPSDCATSWQGRFAIQVVNLAQLQKRDTAASFANQASNGQVNVQLPSNANCVQSSSVISSSRAMSTGGLSQAKRDAVSSPDSAIPTSAATIMSVCQTDKVLSLALINSVLKDSQGRTGYLANDRQFQFDDPPQSGAIVTAGFSICSNGSLALGPSVTWWGCSSGTFSKLYDQNWAAQCSALQLKAVQVVDCLVDPDIVTVGSLGPNVTSFLASLAETPVNLPSRTWAPANALTSFQLVPTDASASSNTTLFNSTLASSDIMVASPVLTLGLRPDI